jgi:predicted oxidoreductase (fatty acid repression mutant protein)
MSAVSTSTTTDAFLDAVKARRSLYQLSKGGSVPDSRVEQIVKEAILHTPTSL